MPEPQEVHPLRVKERPSFEVGDRELRLVDLFAGCGGLTLGVAQAAQAAGVRLNVRLAVDFEKPAHDVYVANFPKANAKLGSVEAYFDGELGQELTEKELATRAVCGRVDVLVGGPPCQGHSNLNNVTRRDDPKNALYARMARAAQVLESDVVMIENVTAVQHDKGDVVGVTRRHLEGLGYTVAAEVIGFSGLGVAQERKRHVLLASKVATFDPQSALNELAGRSAGATLDLRWAIGDLEDIDAPDGFDAPSRVSKDNQIRMQVLIATGEHDLRNEHRPLCHRDGDHSYKSMYGRMWWDKPAQTITSGFGSMGQGRYMHPSRARTLTAHEAARIQGFPDYFSFAKCTKRGELSVMIGNAVPPPLAREVVALALPLLVDVSDGREAAEEIALSVTEPAKHDVAVSVPSHRKHRAARVQPSLS